MAPGGSTASIPVSGRNRKEASMNSPVQALGALLEREGVDYEVLPHRHTETAVAEARALGIAPDHVAKTVVLADGRGYIRAVVPAGERLDVRKLRELLDLRELPRLVEERELACAYPTFELGAIPPIGGRVGDRVAVDRRLADRDVIVVEAGSHDESLRLATTRLLIQSHASIGDLCHD
jgi:Ala-tRNA(Pro) deacylase